MSSSIIKREDIISLETRQTISHRYHTVTKAINEEFWNSSSDTAHSFYVGSYGRNTAVNTSDIDILVEIPESEYNRYSSWSGNGQSRLLQTAKNAVLNSYSRSDIRADGQVVIIEFADDMRFEILPAFPQQSLWNTKITYKYPDTNMGGNWKSTDPKAEQKAMQEKNQYSNGLLCETCRHMRVVRDNNYRSYHLAGIIIDSFVYDAMGSWRFMNSGEESSNSDKSYEQVLLDYYNKISVNGFLVPKLYAPGSKMEIDTSKDWSVLGKVLNYMA